MLAGLAVVLLGAVGYLLALSLGGAEMVSVTARHGRPVISVHNPRLWLIAAAAAAILLVLRVARVQRPPAGAPPGSLTGPDSEQRDRLEAELRRERARRQDLVAAWRSQREWDRALRAALLQGDDAAGAVLALTLDLVGAEKGLLLAGAPGDCGPRGLICHRGFDHDPAASPLVRRFATGRVEPVREAWPDPMGGEEIRNLLAIPLRRLDEIVGVIVCANRPDGFEGLDGDVLEAVGDHAGAVLASGQPV